MRALAIALMLAAAARAATPPNIMLWAWERPGDLRDLPDHVGVAFLSSTVTLAVGTVHTTPRMQPLRVKPGAYRMAVIRIEVPPGKMRLVDSQRKGAADAIEETVRMTKPDAVQIDFDARISERRFYAALLDDVRTRLGAKVFLSATALVSWCSAAPSWVDRLPVDELVPMAFEMGTAAAPTETWLRSGTGFVSPVCRGSIGVAARDLPWRRTSFQRIYVFAYEDWTGSSAREVLAKLR